MKIALVTTVPTFIENKRIEEEVKNLGHEFELVDMREFGYRIAGNIIEVEKLSELQADIVIVRGVLKSIKPMSAYLTAMR